MNKKMQDMPGDTKSKDFWIKGRGGKTDAGGVSECDVSEEKILSGKFVVYNQGRVSDSTCRKKWCWQNNAVSFNAG
jgi:hypothetical protein